MDLRSDVREIITRTVSELSWEKDELPPTFETLIGRGVLMSEPIKPTPDGISRYASIVRSETARSFTRLYLAVLELTLKAETDDLAARLLLEALWPLRKIAVGKPHPSVPTGQAALWVMAKCLIRRTNSEECDIARQAKAMTSKIEEVISASELKDAWTWTKKNLDDVERLWMDPATAWVAVRIMLGPEPEHHLGAFFEADKHRKAVAAIRERFGEKSRSVGAPSGSRGWIDRSTFSYGNGGAYATFSGGSVSLVNGKLSLIFKD